VVGYVDQVRRMEELKQAHPGLEITKPAKYSEDVPFETLLWRATTEDGTELDCQILRTLLDMVERHYIQTAGINADVP
jgi:hypothetical protein